MKSKKTETHKWAENSVVRARRKVKFLMLLCVFLLFTSIISPIIIVSLFVGEIKKPQQVAVIDPEGNLFLTSKSDVEASQELIYWSATTATNSLLQRNKKGLAYAEQAELIFTKEGFKKLDADVQAYKQQASKLNMRWELELGAMEIVRTTEAGNVVVKVEGVIHEHTFYSNLLKSNARSFVLAMSMSQNGDILKKGRVPYNVVDYKLTFTK